MSPQLLEHIYTTRLFRKLDEIFSSPVCPCSRLEKGAYDQRDEDEFQQRATGVVLVGTPDIPLDDARARQLVEGPFEGQQGLCNEGEYWLKRGGRARHRGRLQGAIISNYDIHTRCRTTGFISRIYAHGHFLHLTPQQYPAKGPWRVRIPRKGARRPASSLARAQLSLSLSVDVDNIEENSCPHKQALTVPRTQHPAPTTSPLTRTATHDSSSHIKSSVDGQGIYRHSCNEKGRGR